MSSDPEDILREMRQLVPVLFTAIEDGVLLAHEFFAKRREREEPHLHATLIRYQAKLAFDAAGQQCEFDREDLPNNGLCLTLGRFKLKIFKAHQGGLRGPGVSRTKQAYFKQMRLAFLDDMEVMYPSDKLNLVVLWQISRQGHVTLSLAMPKDADERKHSTECYWHVPIHNPFLRDGALTPSDPSPEFPVDADVDVNDLDIRLRQLPDTGTETSG